MPTMAASTDSVRWVFTKEQLQNTPSRRCNIDYDKEIHYRQQAATLIQEMGQRLQVTQLCINTAIVYLHRFYMFHSFTKFHRNPIAACSLFLAAKVEEQPRKLEHVIRVAHMLLYKDQRLELNSEQYVEQAQELINNENILLQTLGFDVAIDHPHTQVLKCCQHLFRTSSKEMAQTSYFMATNSLHLTTMCLQYKPTVVACVCIHLVCKWYSFEIPLSSEGKDWYWYVDKSVTRELLDELTVEFLAVFDKFPARLRKRVMQTAGVNVGPLDRSSSGSNRHPDAHRAKTESGAQVKPGERIPRPMEPRRDKAGNPIPSSSSGVPSGHRPSSSGHPPSHSNRPPESGGGSSSSQGSQHHGHHHHHHHSSHSSSNVAPHPSGHSHSSSHGSSHGRPPHPHQRPSSGVKDPTKAHPSGSSSQHPPSSHQHQRPPHPQQVPPSSSQKKPPATPQGPKSSNVPQTSTGSLFSPPRTDQQADRKPNVNDLMKGINPLPNFGQDWNDTNQANASNQNNQQNVNLSTSLGFSLDLDIGDDQDSGGWDINCGLDNNLLSSPSAAIESMLSKGLAESSSMNFNVKQEIKQESIFSLSEPSPKMQHPAQVQQLQQTPQTPQMQTTPHLPSTPQLPVTPRIPSTPKLPMTPKPQIPIKSEPPQTPQMMHIQMQHQHQSLFDLGLDSDSFTTIKTEVKTEETIFEMKSTPVGEVVVAAPPDLQNEETVDGESSSGGKKKKKKKEKHKNKDKDREKDKEKKHKHKHKEKDKEKDKHRDKVSMPAGSPNEGSIIKPVLKIKIPKGRIEGDISAPANGSSSSPAVVAPVVPAGGLKIKISKEVLSGSSKEKDRDREREKDKDSRKRTNTTSSSSLSRSVPSAKVPKIDLAMQQYQQQQQQQPPSSSQHHFNMQPIPSGGRPHHERNGSTNPPGEEQRDGRRSSSHTSSHRSSSSSSSGMNKVGHSSTSMQSFPAATTGAVNASVAAAAVPGSTSVPPPPSAASAATAVAAAAANAFHRAAAPGYPPFPPAYPPPGPPPPLGAAPPPYYNPYGAYGFAAYQYPYQQGPPMTAMMNSHLAGPPPMPMPNAAPGAGMPPLPREPPPQVPPPPPPQ